MTEQALKREYDKLLSAYKAKNKELKELKNRKHIEFSKIAVVTITIFCMGCVGANYVLAFLERGNINETVTVALITTILGTVIGYFIKAGKENLIKIKKSKEESEEN